MDTELESMVVKLKGDANQYERMVKEAEASIRRLTGTMAVEDKKVADLARRAATAMMAERKRQDKEIERENKAHIKAMIREQEKAKKEAAKEAEKNSIGANVNAAWSITEKSFIQSIRAVDAMLSRTVASITNGMEGIVRITISAGGRIATAWAGVLKAFGLGGLTTIFSGITQQFGKMASDINKRMGGIPAAIGTTFGGIGQILGTVLAGALGVAGAAAVSFGAEMTRVFHETLELDEQARNLSVTVLDLRAGMLRWGVTASTLSNALTVAQGKISQFNEGSRSATKDLKALASLSGMSVDQITAGPDALFTALANIPDQTQRAAQAFRFLGSEAKQFLRELDRGGMGDAKGMAKRLGLEVTPQDQENLRQISRFTRDVEALKTGLVNQVMLGLAPIAAELTEIFSLSKTDITFIKDMVTRIGLEITKWGAALATAFSNPEAFNDMFALLTTKMLEMAGTFWNFMERRAQEFVNRNTFWLNPGVRFRADPAEERERREAAARPQSIDEFVRRFSSSPIMQMFNRLQTGVENRTGIGGGVNLGLPFLSGAANAISPLTGAIPVPSWVKEVGGVVWEKFNKTKPTADIEKLNQSFDSLVSSLKQPIDAWKQSLSELKQFTKAGLFTQRGDDQAIAAAQMFKRLRESTGLAGTPQFAGAATSGSAEAYSAIAQFRAMQDRGDIQQQMKDAILQGNRQRELMINNGQAVISALKALGEKFEIEEDADIT